MGGTDIYGDDGGWINGTWPSYTSSWFADLLVWVVLIATIYFVYRVIMDWLDNRRAKARELRWWYFNQGLDYPGGGGLRPENFREIASKDWIAVGWKSRWARVWVEKYRTHPYYGTVLTDIPFDQETM
jgi:hypothetical protein